MAAAPKATVYGCTKHAITKGDVICQISYVKMDQVRKEQQEYYHEHKGWMIYPNWLRFDNDLANCYILSNESPNPPRAWLVANRNISDFKMLWLNQGEFSKLEKFMAYVKQYESNK